MRNIKRLVLSEKEVKELRESRKVFEGSTRSFCLKASEELGVKSETIREVIKGRTWKGVGE